MKFSRYHVRILVLILNVTGDTSTDVKMDDWLVGYLTVKSINVSAAF